MRKTANKVRTDSKVVVSTEFEETFEATSATEIQNPNDEIAVTYVYSKLQMQYEIFTQLAEVQDVVMVAEELVPPEGVGFQWVKRHDWIISKVLLDDSFRDPLSSISHEVAQDASGMKSMVDSLLKARTSSLSALEGFANRSGVTAKNIDFAQEAQKEYSAARDRTSRAAAELPARGPAAPPVRAHPGEHPPLLPGHLAERRPPAEDAAVPETGNSGPPRLAVPLRGGEHDVHPPVQGHLRIRKPDQPARNLHRRSGGPTIPINDLINPAGPIGFYGNYALYYMRPEYAQDGSIMPLLEIFKFPYVFNDELMDPGQKEKEELVASGEIPMNDGILDDHWRRWSISSPTCGSPISRR